MRKSGPGAGPAALLTLSMLLSWLLACGPAWAAPLITKATCDGGAATLTLQGTGFGAKAKASPVKWDDFEAGTVGQTVGNGWYTWSNKGAPPRYASDVLRPGSTRSVIQDFTTSQQYNCTLGLSNLGLHKVYISFWKQTKIGGSGPSRNYKIISLRGGAPGEWGAPEARHDIYPSLTAGHIYITGCQNELGKANQWGGAYDLTPTVWQRFEYWVEQSSPNLADGKYFWWLDGKLRSSITGELTRKASCPYTNLYLNAYFATDENGAASMHWLDDIYVDDTQARVEICEASSWASRQHCEIQIPQTWSAATPGSVTVKLNRGSFSTSAFAKAFLYLVDSSGSASPGFPVPSCGGSPADAGSDAPGLPADARVEGLTRGDRRGDGPGPDAVGPDRDGSQPPAGDPGGPAEPAGCGCGMGAPATGPGWREGLLAMLLLLSGCQTAARRRRRSSPQAPGKGERRDGHELDQQS